MLRELPTSSRYYYDEYVRRHVRIPEPVERPRHELRRVIGKGLIHLGERISGGEETSHFETAA